LQQDDRPTVLNNSIPTFSKPIFILTW